MNKYHISYSFKKDDVLFTVVIENEEGAYLHTAVVPIPISSVELYQDSMLIDMVTSFAEALLRAKTAHQERMDALVSRLNGLMEPLQNPAGDSSPDDKKGAEIASGTA